METTIMGYIIYSNNNSKKKNNNNNSNNNNYRNSNSNHNSNSNNLLDPFSFSFTAKLASGIRLRSARLNHSVEPKP